MDGKVIACGITSRAEATLLNSHFETISLPTSQPHNQPNNQVKILTNPFFISLYLFKIITPPFPQGTIFAHSFYKFMIQIAKPIIEITLFRFITAIVVTHSNTIIAKFHIDIYIPDGSHLSPPMRANIQSLHSI